METIEAAVAADAEAATSAAKGHLNKMIIKEESGINTDMITSGEP